MTIQVGDKVPGVTLKTMGPQGPEDITTDDIFSGKKVVLFAVPGAFTPGCSMTHLPGFVVNADKIKAKGVDTIVCMSVNDAFVMGAWGEAQTPLRSSCWRTATVSSPARWAWNWTVPASASAPAASASR